eukprot:GHVS01071593.1.p1 GENE.GHVS01071593.1~~GHVS01071593.1.p1  ORF type:complete len:578 (+),score=26.84 GHVS01071593.1:29-1735(+)
MASTNDQATFTAWTDLRLSKPLLMALSDLQFDSPTPIQREAIPMGLQGRDILGTAQTGSGKTAAFLLPILERLWQSPSVHSRKITPNGPVGGRATTRALILLPTRELAGQCDEMIGTFVKYTPITHALVYGGMNIKAQESKLRYQPDIVVATPGRVLDLLLNSQSVHMEQLEIVVFDEADRLLEMGFKEECLEVLKQCSRTHQTMLFSATLNDQISDLAGLTLSKPVRIRTNPAAKVNETLSQEFIQIPKERARDAVLLYLCTEEHQDSSIIFFQTKKAAHRMSIIFGKLGFSFSELHGNLSQEQRTLSLERFQNGEAKLLLATELAARGLDIASVKTVINFHPPNDIVRYVHRVGRTARMGATGKAVTLFSESQRTQVRRIAKAASSARAKSTEDDSKSFRVRKIQAALVMKWEKKVEDMEQHINNTLKEEKAGRELRLADMYIKKSENLHTFKDEINSRPEKRWHITNKEKGQLREQTKCEAAARQAALNEPESLVKPTRSRDLQDPRTIPMTRAEKIHQRKLESAVRKRQTERHQQNRVLKISGKRAKRAARPKRKRVGIDEDSD